MSVLKSILVAALVCFAALLTVAPAASAQDGYGPEAPAVTAAPATETSEPEVTAATAPEVTTDVSVKSNANVEPEVAGPELGSSQLPVTGSTVFPLLASGIGLVGLGLVLRQADRLGKSEE